MHFEFTSEEWIYIFHVFERYEKKFERNLYCAWEFDKVDWLGMAKAAEQAIESNSSLTDEQISKFHKYEFDEDGKPS